MTRHWHIFPHVQDKWTASQTYNKKQILNANIWNLQIPKQRHFLTAGTLHQNQEPFQLYSLQGPGCKFSSGALFLAPKNPCSEDSTCQSSRDFLDRSCCAALLKDSHRLSGCSVYSCWKPKALVVSADCLHRNSFCALIWTKRWDETAGGQMMWCKPFKASLFWLLNIVMLSNSAWLLW